MSQSAAKKALEADRELNNFVHSLELTAKTILRKANQKRLNDAAATSGQYAQTKKTPGNNNGKKLGKLNKQPKSIVLLDPTKMDPKNSLVDLTSVKSIVATQPNLTVTFNKTNYKALGGGPTGAGNNSSSTGSGALADSINARFGHLPSIPPPSNQEGDHMMNNNNNNNNMNNLYGAIGRGPLGGKILPALGTNPLWKKSMSNAGEKQKEKNKKILSSSTKDDFSKPKAKMSSSLPPRRSNNVETQGPINWDSDDLRCKYRDDDEREMIWLSYLASLKEAADMEKKTGVVIPVIEIERHTIYKYYYEYIEKYNAFAVYRARMRNRMKRFIFDVHAVWVTNLHHLKEHVDSLAARNAPIRRGNGLQDRRDVKAIQQKSSQIQSVSQQRALQDSIFSTHGAPGEEFDAAELIKQYKCPHCPGPDPIPAKMWALVDREPIKLGKKKRPYHYYVHRLQRTEDDMPLWRIGAYDVATGVNLQRVCTETDIVKTINDNVLYKSMNEERKLKESGIESLCVHRQGARIPCGNGTAQSCLIQVNIEPGPFDQVIIELQVFPYKIVSTEKIIVKVTSYEVKARLSLADAPALNLDWWRATKGNQSIWRPLISVMMFKLDENGDFDSIAFKDLRTTQDENFDFYATLANAYVLVNLLVIQYKIENDNDNSNSKIENSNSNGDGNENPASSKGVEELKYDDYIDEGPGDSLEISGIAIEDSSFETGFEWEEESDFTTTLTKRTSGREEFVTVVPGTIDIGKWGIWKVYKFDKERTRGLAVYFRDKSISSTDSVLVTSLLSLDTPTITPKVIAWEPFNSTPPSPPEEDPDGIIPPIAAYPTTLIKERVISDLDTRGTVPITCLSTVPDIPDYSLEHWSEKDRQANVRYFPSFADFGFRQILKTDLMVPSAIFPTYIFGITCQGTVPNSAGMNGRATWHSEQLCTEEIVRRRGPKDFAFISKKTQHGGFNDPSCYTLNMRHGKMDHIGRSGYNKEYLKMYDDAKEVIDENEKDRALARKIKAGQAIIEKKKFKEKERHAEIQRKALEATRKRTAAAKDTSSKSWSKRIQRSNILKICGSWEEREIIRSGNLFYNNRAADLIEAQWDMPDEWVERRAEAYDPLLHDQAQDDPRDDIEGLDEDSKKEEDEEEKPLGNLTMLPDGTVVQGSVEDIVDSLCGNEELISKVAEALGASAFVPLVKRRKASKVGHIDDSNMQVNIPQSLQFPPTLDQGEGDITSSNNNNDNDGFPTSLDSDRPWSDSDEEVGNDDMNPREHHPSNHTDTYELKKIDARFEQDLHSGVPKLKGRPEAVPALDIKKLNEEDPAMNTLAAHVGVKGKGWKRLPRATVHRSFIKECSNRKTIGPDKEACNSVAKPVMMGIVDPSNKNFVDYTPQTFSIKIDSFFVPDVMQDIERNVEMLQARIEREALLAGGGSLSQIVERGIRETTAVEDAIKSTGAVVKEMGDLEVKAQAEMEACIAVKSNNLERLEVAMDNRIDIECMDEFGNTLMLLAAQQGNKRMCKFLLRRGANINSQNTVGNSVLHYCYEYSHIELAKYLQDKGADTRLLNKEGLTCYEGLQRDNLDGF